MAQGNGTSQDRDAVIIRTSIIGIIANILLSAFKAVVGILTNSIAVTLDAVNNMTDALSSVVTIIGTKLASKKPDKKHPLGYGRIEYLTTMIIAAIILYAGITSLTESVDKILNPELPDYSTVSLIIIGAAVLVKVVLGTYVKKKGESVKSGSLIASGKDALFDAVLSTSVLVSAIIFVTTDISLEAYVGVLISIFIIKSSIEMMKESIDEILGNRPEEEFKDAIRSTICQEEGVTGAYDLILHNYGADRMVGSVHVEVPGSMTAIEIDALDRKIANRVFKEHCVLMAGIGIYAVDESNESASMRTEITRIVMSHKEVLQMHGFRVDHDAKIINADIIIDYAVDEREELFKSICKEIQDRYPDYKAYLVLDIDI